MYNRCHYQLVFKIGLVIIFSLVTIPDAGASSRCPYKCKCSANSIMCMEQELVEVPEFKRIIFKPTTINLSKNEIEEITNLSFSYKNLEMLINLILQDNPIYDMHEKAFYLLPRLQYLDLSNNLIEDFSGDLISCNKELKELRLTGNLFGSKTPELKSDSLEILDLSFCKLSHFSKKSVEGLPKLRFLYLQVNNLMEIDYTIFGEHLKFVDLSFNTWKCQCSTIKLFNYLVGANLTVVSNVIECSQPFRRFEEIFDANGAVQFDKWCGNKTTTNRNTLQISQNTTAIITTNKEEMCIENKILIGSAITFCIIVAAGVILIYIFQKHKRSKQNISSKNTAYDQLPARKMIVGKCVTAKR